MKLVVLVMAFMVSACAGTPTAADNHDPLDPVRVSYEGARSPGDIIVDTSEKTLLFVENGGTALRYRVGVARPGFEWQGTHRISDKREWPGWRPPAAMRKREPDLPAYIPGGPRNPLGARALYIGSTLYRIHGTSAPSTIGRAMSSGCIRMRNEDVIALYERVETGATVVVY